MKSRRKKQTTAISINKSINSKTEELEPKINNSLTKCDLCLKPFNSCVNKPSSLLNEDFLTQIIKIINVTSDEDNNGLPSNIYSCEKCKAQLNSLLSVFVELENLRTTFDNMKEIVAKQIMLGPLAMLESDFNEWKSELTSKQSNGCNYCSIGVDKQTKIVGQTILKKDVKLTQMTAVVPLKRLSTPDVPNLQLEPDKILLSDIKVEEDFTFEPDDSILDGFVSPIRETKEDSFSATSSQTGIDSYLQHKSADSNITQLKHADLNLENQQSIHKALPRSETENSPLNDGFEEHFFIDVKLEEDEDQQTNEQPTEIDEEANDYADELQTKSAADSESIADDSIQISGRQLRKRKASQLNIMYPNEEHITTDEEEVPTGDESSTSEEEDCDTEGSDDYSTKRKRSRLNFPSIPKKLTQKKQTQAKIFANSSENETTQSKKKFECPICHKKLRMQRNLTQHINRMHKEFIDENNGHAEIFFGPVQMFECSFCSSLLESKALLKIHKEEIHGHFECGWCKFQAKTAEEFSRHKKLEHKLKSKTISRLKKNRRYKKCTVCSILIGSTGAERIHMASVHGIFIEEPTLSCKYCDVTFNDQSLLGAHTLYVHSFGSIEQGNSQCDLCLRFMRSNRNVENHKKIVHYGNEKPKDGMPPENIKCFICSESPTLSNPEGLKLHEESEEHKMNIKSRIKAHCNVCRKNFDKDVAGFQAHLKSEEHEKEVKSLGQYDRSKFCVPCRQTFTTFEELKKHEAVGVAHKSLCEEYKGFQNESSETGNKFMCHACPNIFKEKTTLTRHVTKFHPTGGHKCKNCEMTFTEWTELTRHRQMHKKENKSATCDECGNTFATHKYLLVHIRSVHSKVTYTCEVCGKSFNSKNRLKAHFKNIHDRAVAKLECPHCDASMPNNQPVVLRKHFCKSHPSIYLKEKPHYCLVCYYNFTEESELKCHMEEAHSSLKCPHCGNFFPQKGHLLSHIRVHTGERPFKCPLCDCRFKTNGNLTNHKKAVHANESITSSTRKKRTKASEEISK